LNDCQEILRRLIADGDTSGIPLAERAINEYLDATPTNARKSGLRLLQEVVIIQRDAVVGGQHSFADAVNAYIEKKLTEESGRLGWRPLSFREGPVCAITVEKSPNDWHTADTRNSYPPVSAAKNFPCQGTCWVSSSLTAPPFRAPITHPPKALSFSMESLAMRNRLQVSFWGLHLSADGIFAIAAALLIIIAILVSSWL
jgi:hypothetical protein